MVLLMLLGFLSLYYFFFLINIEVILGQCWKWGMKQSLVVVLCDKAPLVFSPCFEGFMINRSSPLKPSFLHFNCKAVVSPLVILSELRAALYFPEHQWAKMSWCRDACRSSVFIDPCIDILFLGRVGITMAIKETELHLALGNLSSATGSYWLMWGWGWGEVADIPLPLCHHSYS